ncbi:diaminopimelate epimerase [Actinomadura atramentaria]|uniref:diaminopimelate epimerase n=1 Tax=Actinomadura atramentaria TaxID=1990 RepID=UPI0003736744|nr:diaminopimelate epimerase [Actinomadura atramentaria]
MRFLKGHGTENDFVILPDPDGELELTPEAVARLCDRRAGIGGDGVLRVVRAKAAGADAAGQGAEWFMDYRNHDGGVAEMCGNGVRVFARYLVAAGLAEPGEWDVATRSGPRRVALGADGDVRVAMGLPSYLGTSAATLDGRELPGVSVSVGNPHLACRVDVPVADLDLSRAPGYDPAVYPEGVNVEFFRPVGDHHVEMRVYERGSGETRSCGTGTVAVALAAALAEPGAEPVPPGRWTVDVPGGRLTVTLEEETAYLAGPAVLVAEGELDPGALTR